MNRPQRLILADIKQNDSPALREELAHVRSLTLNEMDYGCKPEEMGTTGLVDYVRGHHWPFVPESTCFVARMQCAEEIVAKRCGPKAVELFRKAVYAGRN